MSTTPWPGLMNSIATSEMAVRHWHTLSIARSGGGLLELTTDGALARVTDLIRDPLAEMVSREGSSE